MPRMIAGRIHEFIGNRKGQCTQLVQSGRKMPPHLCGLVEDVPEHQDYEPLCSDNWHSNVVIESIYDDDDKFYVHYHCNDCGKDFS